MSVGPQGIKLNIVIIICVFVSESKLEHVNHIVNLRRDH